MPTPWRWRYFGTREVGLAREWAGAGGISVHENLFRSRGRRAAHLLALDEALLLTAARLLGCQEWWIQRTRTVHFDLVGIHLERALRICGVDPTFPPTRVTHEPTRRRGAEASTGSGSHYLSYVLPEGGSSARE